SGGVERDGVEDDTEWVSWSVCRPNQRGGGGTHIVGGYGLHVRASHAYLLHHISHYFTAMHP
ncbi:unnamed protein product, partial [Sphenostylis stenocarpa]